MFHLWISEHFIVIIIVIVDITVNEGPFLYVLNPKSQYYVVCFVIRTIFHNCCLHSTFSWFFFHFGCAFLSNTFTTDANRNVCFFYSFWIKCMLKLLFSNEFLYWCHSGTKYIYFVKQQKQQHYHHHHRQKKAHTSETRK